MSIISKYEFFINLLVYIILFTVICHIIMAIFNLGISFGSTFRYINAEKLCNII